MTQIDFDTLIDGKPIAIDVDGKPVCVVRAGEEVFAVSNICTHSYAELSDGEVKGSTIECWLHGAEFDLRTGSAITLPATEALETFVVNRNENVLTISSESDFSKKMEM
ncbi:MAG: non-heme iron oxygenase ferredoxin subunit [Actinomycetota bacterium]